MSAERMPDAVEDGEGTCWQGDTGTRERRVERTGLVGLVGFFMVLVTGRKNEWIRSEP
jgi:hypothetical protein